MRLLAPLLVIFLAAVGGLTGTLATGSSPELGLDLQGGVSVVLSPATDPEDDQLDQSVEIMRSRVDALGVAEPSITRQGDNVVVELPGARNRDRAIELVGETAELQFRPVLQVLGQPTDDAEGEPEQPTTTAPAGDAAPSTPELTPREEDDPEHEVVLGGLREGEVYRLGPSRATGRIVDSARAQVPTGQWAVNLSMRGGEDGIDTFNEIAAECFNQTEVCPTRQLAIVLDSVVQSAPQIQEPRFARDAISISGDFDESEAKDLALVLRYGALPIELERQTVETVSASLGEDSLRAGIIAGFVGLAAVALYMVAYYRALGLVVVVGMALWGALLYTIVSVLGETQGLALTLAGATGIIVSVGVAVDSYIVFFERLKEEVRAGNELEGSPERAFKRAFRTIMAANITAFLGAGILWWLTIGSVRGFAFFLGLSTLLGVVVTWFYTRPTVIRLSQIRAVAERPIFGVARSVTGAPAPPGSPRPETKAQPRARARTTGKRR